MRQFEVKLSVCSYVILWHIDNLVHTRVVKAIDEFSVFLPFFSFFLP